MTVRPRAFWLLAQRRVVYADEIAGPEMTQNNMTTLVKDGAVVAQDETGAIMMSHWLDPSAEALDALMEAK